MSEEAVDIRHDLRENHRAGDRETNCRVFCQDLENKCQNIVEEPAPSETKRETAHGVRAMDVGALIILGTFAWTRPEEDDGDKPGTTGTLPESHSGRAALRREQREQLESKQHENRATGRKVRPLTDAQAQPIGHSGHIALRKEHCGV
jgi:hypothetical protein